MRAKITALLLFSFASAAWAGDYDIDADHSSVSFKIRHLVGKVKGDFGKFKGGFTFEKGKPGDAKATALIDAASINTGVKKRDDHLRSADFFDVKKFPELKFESTKYDASGDEGKLHGNLTIHGVTKPVVLEVKFNGEGKDPWGNMRAGFTGTTTVNRKDFGLGWNKALETGGLLVGDDVEIALEIEGIPAAGAGKKAKK